MIITISGNPGSGKSTIAKMLAQELKYERIYAGGIMREMARERGITLEELMRQAEKDQKIDTEVDYRVRDTARKYNAAGKNVLVEGRVQFYHLPESIKIYVRVDELEGAKRIWKDLQDKEASLARNQKIANSVEEVVENNRIREKTDAQRYVKLYGVDYRDMKNYDLLVDSTSLKPEEVVQKIKNYILGKHKE